MHFQFLVEDVSGKEALDLLIPKMIDSSHHTFDVKSYKGIGAIPKNLNKASDPRKRILLDQLPRLLKGYGRSFQSFDAVLIIVCDLDDRDKSSFLLELTDLLNGCKPVPNTYFCLAIEEGEAWLPGDMVAVRAAFPNAKLQVLNKYKNDAICGTWELLADAVYSGGSQALKKSGYQKIGSEKFKWASMIPPHMNVHSNKSPSFNNLKSTLEGLC